MTSIRNTRSSCWMKTKPSGASARKRNWSRSARNNWRSSETARYSGKCRQSFRRRRSRRASRPECSFHAAVARPAGHGGIYRSRFRQNRNRNGPDQRSGASAQRRQPDLQFLLRHRRLPDEDLARHPGRRASVQHASADPDLRGPGRARSAIRPSIHNPRSGRTEIEQAPRRHFGGRVPPPGISAAKPWPITLRFWAGRRRRMDRRSCLWTRSPASSICPGS